MIKERQLNQEVTAEAAHVCGQQLLIVVNALHGDLTLADRGEVVGICGDEKHLWIEEKKGLPLVLKDIPLKCPHPTDELGFVSGHDLVEDVVAPLLRQLERHSGLLQQVWVRWDY